MIKPLIGGFCPRWTLLEVDEGVAKGEPAVWLARVIHSTTLAGYTFLRYMRDDTLTPSGLSATSGEGMRGGGLWIW